MNVVLLSEEEERLLFDDITVFCSCSLPVRQSAATSNTQPPLFAFTDPRDLIHTADLNWLTFTRER